eukprot:CAMPEP_0181299994 /NCGR_PEP_ID=MMETSP1101-20121128/6647_1 /TAXON_ID=46948 /ORGANISM="Rhodomonas abbreviata, Strain Caron Lab Isolate" /LENGTH=195 /DNA_ID=CAMNT_0023405189 /DNA_START=189 /DNA_END=776 /DNA_ORIENTATION=-
MKPFTGVPWKTPAGLGSRNQPRDKPSDWFERYQKMISLGAGQPITKITSSGSRKEASNFEQTELNPGVAFDKTTKKFCILNFEHGIPKPRGSFFTDEDGMTAYSGYHDLLSRGPHGIAGVPRSRFNNGPPGAALAPEGHWKNNKGTERKRPTTALLREKGWWTGSAPDHGQSSNRRDLVEHQGGHDTILLQLSHR